MHPPDVILVVLDTVRADYFVDGSDPAVGQTFLRQISGEARRFPRAVAPAPWTLPSHASLFTGLPPWEHRLYGRGRGALPNGIVTLAESLHLGGYQTASFSANPLVSPATGLDRGFDQSWWGGWHEGYLRGVRRRPSFTGTSATNSLAAEVTRHPWTSPIANLIQRRPSALGALLRFQQLNHGTPASPCVSPWIEDCFDGWVRSVPQERPVFAFVNFMDAHEPYIGLPLPAGNHPLRAEAQKLDPRQDRQAWLEGSWVPSEAEMGALRNAYRSTYAILDGRLRAIYESLHRTGRWANSCLVVTSDHGQAFGEEGMMFHGLRAMNALLRVPLWIRPPEGAYVPSATEDWIPLEEVPRLVETMVGGNLIASGGKVAKASYGEAEVSSALGIADGVLGPVRARLSPQRLRQLDRPSVCLYQGRHKTTLDVCEGTFQIERLDPPEGLLPEDSPVEFAETVQNTLRQIAERAFGATRGGSNRTVDRLQSWGY